MTTPVPTRISAEEFLYLPEGEGHELVDGELVEVGMGFDSSWIGGELHRRMANFVLERGLGITAPQETGIQVWPDRPNLVRKPDAMFIRAGRMPAPRPQGWLRVVPDLVVEVISPNERAEVIEQKLIEYRRASVPLVWVLYPSSRTAHVFRADRSYTELGPEDVLDGEDILPGFRCPLAELFDQ